MEPTPPATPPAPDTPVRYATRNNAFEPACTWVLDGPWLWREVEGQSPVMIRLEDLQSIRLQFAPSRPEPNRYCCGLTLRNGASYSFFNRTYAGPYNFPDTSREYNVFVRALHAALARHHPGIDCLAGPGIASYLLQGGFVIAAFLLLAGVLLLTGMQALATVQVIFIVFYLPTLLHWFKRNRRTTYPLHGIPADLLPAGSPDTSG